MEKLDAFIDQLERVPAAPRILPELLTLLHHPDIDSSRVAPLLALDPVLTGQVLRVCNSALLGGLQPAEDVPEALTRLGFRPVYELVAAASGARTLTPALDGYGLEQGELWRHSVMTAVAAQGIARERGEEASLTFTAGLLHDTGKIVLSQFLGSPLLRRQRETETHQRSRRAMEKRLLGVEHAEIGGRLLTRWKLPASLAAAVRFHHDPAAAGPHARLAALVHLGNLIAHSLGFTSGRQSFALQARSEAFAILDLDPAQWPGCVRRAYDKLDVVQALLEISN